MSKKFNLSVLNNNLFFKIISCIIVIAMIFPQFNLNLYEKNKSVSNGISVKIKSFMRGEVNDIRSSELMQAVVEGYEGNTHELTYTWTNNLGTYLYIYNSHNMYNIMNTDGEIEIKKKTGNVANSASGVGFAWAAVYGANLGGNSAYKDKNGTITSLRGGISVKVTDNNGNIVGSASYNNNFLEDNLASDLSNSVFGIFIGETANVKDLLGESAIVHVDCSQSSVISGNLITGTNVATLYLKNGNYYVDGINKGVATVNLYMEKNNCKFHQYSSGIVETKVYVFKKPNVNTTTSTITLNNLDSDCKYYLNGVEGIAKNGVITFEGLTPNTDYQVEVQASYKNAANEMKNVYTYIYTTTKPVYIGKVTVNLDNEPCNIEKIYGQGAELYLKEEKDINNNYIKLNKVENEVGVYNAILENGVYNIYSKENDKYKLEHYQQLIIKDANRDRNMNFYSVKYDANGGQLDTVGIYTETYHENTTIYVTDKIPTRKGYRFEGWSYKDYIVKAENNITTAISEPLVLKAIWIPIKDKVNVKYYINHKANSGELDSVLNEFLTLHLTRKLENEQNYVSVNGNDTELIYTSKEWTSKGVHNDNTTIVDLGTVFEGLDSTYDYSINTGIKGYDVIDTVVMENVDEEGNTIYNIEVYMEYNPDMFVMNFLFEMAEGVDKSLWPDSVDVKVTKFYKPDSILRRSIVNREWYPVESHMYTTRAIRLEEDGTANANYQVEVFEDADNDKVYYYRIQVEGLHIDDEYITLDNKDETNVIYNSSNNTYSVVVNVDGITPEGTNLEGVYGLFDKTEDKYVQQGNVLAIIDVDTYNISLNANGGIFANDVTEIKLENLIKMPEISASDYIPTRDDNYIFKGWYYLDENNQEVEVPPKETLLNTLNLADNRLVLYAKWASPLTITGTVSAADTYILNGEEVNIHSADLPNGVKILLQEVGANGKGYTIAEQDKKFRRTGINKVGKITYSFIDIPNDGKKYQISILATNYDDTYQNALTGGLETDYQLYNKNDCEAIFDTNSNSTSTFVNIYLSFNPQEYNVEYEIDASEIKKNLRPTNISTLILYNDLVSNNDPRLWPTISQLDSGGIINNLDEYGKVRGSYPVWIVACNDNRLYEYSLLIDKYYLNGIDTIHTNSAPFNIGYTAISRYDYVTRKGTNILKAKLSPKNYNIILDINTSDTVENMEEYILENDVYGLTYQWGDEINITAKPKRDNFIFMGWYDDEGKAIDKYESGFYGDITLKAKWLVDNNNDSIPDEYQKEIVFRVINGIWNNGTTNDYSVFIELKDEKGQYSSSGKGILELPKGMVPMDGYNKKGSWTNKELNGLSRLTVIGNNKAYYYYSFLKNNTVVYESVADNVNTETHTHEVTVVENEYIRINSNGGKWIYENVEYSTVVDFVIKNDGMLIRNPVRKGYVFAGWKCIDGPNIEGIKYTFEATWKIDSNNDGVADECQKRIIFKVINGTWEDATTVDIVKWITLYNEDSNKSDSNGKGTLEIPINMIPNYGYESGSWQDISPKSTITKNSASEYTFSFKKIKDKNIKYAKYISSTECKVESVDCVEYGKKIIINPNGGSLYYNGIEYIDTYQLIIEDDLIISEAFMPGFEFLGWEVTEGSNNISNIYTARYEQIYNDYGIMLIDDFEYSSYRVEYYYDNVMDKVLTVTNNDVLVGDTINSYSENQKTSYTLDIVENYPLHITSNSDNNVIKVYYSKDINNDNVPDKYQAKITYKIINGSWSNDSKEDRTIVFNLKENVDNKWVDKESTLANTIPNDMKPDYGYIDEGTWCSDITDKTVVTEDTIYTYTFIASTNQTSLIDNSAYKEDNYPIDINYDNDDYSDTKSEIESEATITDIDTDINKNKENDNNTVFKPKAAEIKDIVKTFDDNNVELWKMIMFIVFILIVGINCYNFKKKKE